MIKKSGYADLPLHTGVVPKWLADRMRDLGTQIVEAIIIQYGKKEVLRRLSDPLWFQSLGAVLGMDWHSSGITTSVMYALKRGINARAKEFGLCVCGGRGKYSRQTLDEITFLSEYTGLNGTELVSSSKLCAKVDGCAVQDGFQLYQHNFILSDEGDWAVVQQGMNSSSKMARRYHWLSEDLKSFVEEPHTAVTGENQGLILNLTDKNALSTREKILSFSKENPDKIIKEIKLITKSNEEVFLFEEYNQKLEMPIRHELKPEDVDLKRLGAVLATAYENENKNFEDLLLTPGLGPRTLQSLTLVSEVIYGTPARFKDPARFSFAHGGKDGHPFPVPLKIYDESIRILSDAIEKSKLNYNDKSLCIKRLHQTAVETENHFSPEADFEKTIQHEKENSQKWGGKTISCH
jgi:hypothetical protein